MAPGARPIPWRCCPAARPSWRTSRARPTLDPAPLRPHFGTEEEDGEMQSRDGPSTAMQQQPHHRKELTMTTSPGATLLEEARSLAAGATSAYYDGNQHVFEEAAKLATTLALVDIAESLRELCADRLQHDRTGGPERRGRCSGPLAGMRRARTGLEGEPPVEPKMCGMALVRDPYRSVITSAQHRG